MSCAISVKSREINATDYTGRDATVSARLLTDELRRLIERQNVDCRDINCMRWPLFGMSRHGVCKLLLLKNDVMALLSYGESTESMNTSQANTLPAVFDITFESEPDDPITFWNMSMAHVQPLMVSGFGSAMHGEAMYVVTFKCPRWAMRCARSRNSSGDHLSDRDWVPGKVVSNSSASNAANTYRNAITSLCDCSAITAGTALINDPLSYGLGVSFPPIYRPQSVWESSAAISLAAYLSEPVELGSADHKPFLNVIDDMARNAGVAAGLFPFRTGANSRSYYVAIHAIDQGVTNAVAYLDGIRDRIIAGTITHLGSAPPGMSGDLARFVIPLQATKMGQPNQVYLKRGSAHPPDGRPPAVFNPSASLSDYTTPSDTGKFDIEELSPIYRRGAGWDLRGAIAAADSIHSNGPGYGVIEPGPYGGFACIAASGSSISPTSGSYEQHLADRRIWGLKSGVCDVWLSGWLCPSYQNGWAGGSWIELRLQTDDKGFGFPTTRIHGSLEDSLVCPQFSDGDTAIEGGGMVRTWRGDDGKTHAHVEWPFGIPCLIRITNSTRINAGIPIWRYTANIVVKNRADATAPANATEYQGGLAAFRDCASSLPEHEIIAYNISETNNSAAFAAPGYKLPFNPPTFEMLPIGEDRDGNKRDVVVQAMLYRGYNDGTARTCAYFCLTNAVDGYC
jgi:hypothetical protein